MHTIKRIGFIATHVLALVLTAATFAHAQSSESERPPMKLGPVELWPTMLFRNIGVDNNVFNDPENPKKDFTLTVAPNLEAVVRASWMKLSYQSITEFVWFRQYKTERSANRGFQARAEFNLGFLQPHIAAGAMQTKERQNTEIDVRARRQTRNYSAGVRAKLGTAASVSAGARKATSRFIAGDQFRGVDLATELNNETNALDVTLQLDLTPLTTVGITASRDEDRFDTAGIRNSNAVRIAPTVSFKPFGLFNGSASVGFMRFDAVDPNVQDYTGVYASGTIGTTLQERYRIETTFSRDVRYSYDRQTPTYVSTSGRGTLRTDLIGGFDLKLSAGRDVMNYRPLAGEARPGADTYNLYSIGIGWTKSERMRFGIDGEFFERKSGRAGRGYENNRIYGTITWGVRPQ
jgi:hypothetical protein